MQGPGNDETSPTSLSPPLYVVSHTSTLSIMCINTFQSANSIPSGHPQSLLRRLVLICRPQELERDQKGWNDDDNSACTCCGDLPRGILLGLAVAATVVSAARGAFPRTTRSCHTPLAPTILPSLRLLSVGCYVSQSFLPSRFAESKSAKSNRGQVGIYLSFTQRSVGAPLALSLKLGSCYYMFLYAPQSPVLKWNIYSRALRICEAALLFDVG